MIQKSISTLRSRSLSENNPLKRATYICFGEILIFFGTEFKIDSDLLSFDVMTRSWPTYPSIFTKIDSLAAKLPNSGRINPVKMALAIFLKLCGTD